MNLEIGVAWALGIVLATVRSGAFVIAGGLIPRSIPKTIRASPAIAFGVLVAHPISSTSDAGALVVLAAMNGLIGIGLGWLLGLAVTPFQVAGSLLDMGSGLTAGALFDKESHTSPGPVSKITNLAGLTLIIAVGGLGLSARVLDASVHAVALDGKLNGFAVLGPVATLAVSRAMRAGIELALPITSVLFLAEVGFGLLSRLAPQINAFLVGLPLKLLTLLLLLGSFVVVFPATADRTIADALAMIRTALRTFGG